MDDNGDAWFAHEQELHQQFIEECIRRLEKALQEFYQTRDFKEMGEIQ